MLAAVLEYHIIPMSLPAASLTMPSYKTVAGPSVYVYMMNGMVYFNQAEVVKANIMASNNSVIHIIDAVILKSYMPGNSTMGNMTMGNSTPSMMPKPKKMMNSTSAAGAWTVASATMAGAAASALLML
jgi:hypothetical protein